VLRQHENKKLASNKADTCKDSIKIKEADHLLSIVALPYNDLITHIPLPLRKGEEGLLQVKTIHYHLINRTTTL
jgi:hypothetical protein